jgi:signal transduction histidine kinase
MTNHVLEAARASAPRHTLVLRSPARLMANVDPIRLEQVVTNLVDNAIKYSPKGGAIDVRIGVRKGMLRVEVADRGIGIPLEHRALIFDRFHQAHQEHRLGGMGLGLYISRQIVELHGGQLVCVASDAAGTRMLVTIPAGTP